MNGSNEGFAFIDNILQIDCSQNLFPKQQLYISSLAARGTAGLSLDFSERCAWGSSMTVIAAGKINTFLVENEKPDFVYLWLKSNTQRFTHYSVF